MKKIQTAKSPCKGVSRSEVKKAFVAAFPNTVPILTGFLFLGISCGVYMTGSGFPFWYPIVSSVFVFAGSMEFVLVSLLLGAFDPLAAVLMTLMINARHLFYGISMLEKYKGTGKVKPYLIFGLCDESFSINCAIDPPSGVNKKYFMLFVTILNQSYWVIGSTLGGILGSVISIELRGIEFVMTAMFVVIFLEQWLKHKNHVCELAGLTLSVVCLLLFGAESFIIPSMVAIVIFLLSFKRLIVKDTKGGDAE